MGTIEYLPTPIVSKDSSSTGVWVTTALWLVYILSTNSAFAETGRNGKCDKKSTTTIPTIDQKYP